MKIIAILFVIILMAVVIVQVYFVFGQRNIETYPYEVKKKYDRFEIRSYEATLFTTVKLSIKGFKNSSSKGFSILAGYIFGNNERSEKISMTSPVSMSLEDSTTMMFMVPKKFNKEMLPKPQLIPLLTGADLFLCPSIYEPLGIVNLEAMACQTAVLASRVGGIPEVVDDGVTGKLVDYTTDSSIFESNIAAGINEMMGDPERLKRFGIAGRTRAITEFGWDAVAAATIALYRSVL